MFAYTIGKRYPGALALDPLGPRDAQMHVGARARAPEAVPGPGPRGSPRALASSEQRAPKQTLSKVTPCVFLVFEEGFF